MIDRFDHTLERKLESKTEEPGDAGRVRRIELITGTVRRRRWPDDEKARIIIESFKPGANVSEVARRNGVSPQQLFGWRRETRELLVERPASVLEPTGSSGKRVRSKTSVVEGTVEQTLAFAPVVVATHAAPSAPPPPPPPAPIAPISGHIEIAIGDAVVRVIGQVETAHLAVILRAIRRAS